MEKVCRTRTIEVYKWLRWYWSLGNHSLGRSMARSSTIKTSQVLIRAQLRGLPAYLEVKFVLREDMLLTSLCRYCRRMASLLCALSSVSWGCPSGGTSCHTAYTSTAFPSSESTDASSGCSCAWTSSRRSHNQMAYHQNVCFGGAWGHWRTWTADCIPANKQFSKSSISVSSIWILTGWLMINRQR